MLQAQARFREKKSAEHPKKFQPEQPKKLAAGDAKRHGGSKNFGKAGAGGHRRLAIRFKREAGGHRCRQNFCMGDAGLLRTLRGRVTGKTGWRCALPALGKGEASRHGR